MKVAFDVSPVKTGHQVRGIGVYTQGLVTEFKKGEWPDIKFEFFQKPASPPPADVIHYPYFDLFFKTLPQKKHSGRVVITIHDVIPMVFPKHFPVGLKGHINLFLQKMALKNADAVICDSQTSKNDIVNKLSYPKEKIHVIYLAPSESFRKIPENELPIIIKKYKLPQKFILYVGDVNWNKNIPNLLQAVKITKVNLVMVGAAITNPYLPETTAIDNLITELDIKNQVTKTGFVKEADLIAIYNAASLTIQSSFYEGFGLPVLESMACGTPVVCSNVASLAEIAGPAIFCDPTNPSDIADKINHVLSLSNKEKDIISQKSIEHAAKFSWHKVAKHTIDVYQKVYKIPGHLPGGL